MIRLSGMVPTERMQGGPKKTINENTVDTLRDIVDNKQSKTIRFDNGRSTRVDLFTASALLAVYDSLRKRSNKEKFERMANESPEQLSRLADMAFKNVR